MTQVLLLSGVIATMTAATPAATSNDAFFAERTERLEAEDGWLALVGLHWLNEGPNEAGSAPDAPIALPPSTPAKLGTFTRQGDHVTFTPAPGVALTLNGKPFTGGPIKTDRGDGEPDVLHLGTVQILVIVRGQRVGVRIRDSAATARASFHGVERFPFAASWRKEARFEPAAKGQTVHITNVLGDVVETPLAGDIVFQDEGKEFRLEATWDEDSLFVGFGDLTNKDATYPAGRFLSTDAPKDGKVVVDFNRAINPPCAFSSFATCPLPTKKNRLPIRIEAGEKRFGHGDH